MDSPTVSLTGVLPFEPICRFITGLILSPNKTLQGIYDLQVWEGEAPSRRAMHEGVFELGWDGAAFIEHHRAEVAHAYQGRGRPVISLDWTLSHHERGPKIYAVTKSYDYLERRRALFQTVVTAVVSNREWIDWRRQGSACWNCCYSRIHQLRLFTRPSPISTN